MTPFAASESTTPTPLVRLTLTLGPEDRHAIAQLVVLSGAGSRTDAMRDLVARLSTSSSAVRTRLLAAAVPPLPEDTSQSRRLDLRIAAPDRAALERWCAGQLRPQHALRAALHALGKDSGLAVELGYKPDDAPAQDVVRPTPPAPQPTAQPPRAEPPPPPRRTVAPPTPDRASAPDTAPKPPRSRKRSQPEPVASAWYDPPSANTAPWPPTPRTIPQVEVADSWQTSTLLDDLKSGREPIKFAPEWTDEVEDAVEDLVEVLGSGDSVTIVIGFRQEPWEEYDEDGDLIASDTTWTHVPVRRPKSVAREMLHAAHAAGSVNLEAWVHRVEEDGSTGAIVELVVVGAF